MALTEQEQARQDTLVDRLYQAALGTLDVMAVYIGDRMGYYRILGDGPVTSVELAGRAGASERYAREWLEQQAVTGILTVDDAALDAPQRLYSLPPGHAELILDPTHGAHALGVPVARAIVASAMQFPALLEAYRTGGGVAWGAFGEDLIEATGDFRRAMYVNLLARAYIPAVPDLHERLLADPPARLADVGCGTGWAGISIAQAYPKVTVDGFDLDAASIDAAARNAAASGVDGRVRFAPADAARTPLPGTYDVVTVLEALHDMSHPVEVLANIRASVADGGFVIVADEPVGERFTAPGDPVERFMYGFSQISCLPGCMSEPDSAETGTVMRPATLGRYAREAGFTSVEVLPIENDFLRFYRLVP